MASHPLQRARRSELISNSALISASPASDAPEDTRRYLPAAIAGLLAPAAAVWAIAVLLRPFALGPTGIRDISAIYVLLTAGLAWVVTYSLSRLLRWGQRAFAREVALRTAMAAVWLAPTAVFMRDASEWVLLPVVALVVAVVRLVAWLSASESPAVQASESPAMFGLLHASIPPGELAADVAVVLLAEGATLADVAARPLLAALLVAVGAWLFVRRHDERTVTAPRRPSVPLRLSVAGTLTVLALLPHLVVPVGGSYAIAGGSDWSLVRTLKLLFGYVPGHTREIGEVRGRGARAGGSGTAKVEGTAFPGVVLLPESTRVTTLVAPPVRAAGDGFSPGKAEPLTIPFYGVYWILRTPDQPPPDTSLVQRGNPARQSFISNDYRPLWMEARQNLGVFLDLDCCSAVRVELTDADYYSNQVALELVLKNSVKHEAETLGIQPVTTDSMGPRPLHRTVSFAVPRRRTRESFDELTVRFWLGRSHTFRSARISIDGFVLVPPGRL